MKRIRITESQVNILKQELASKNKKQVIKITESQYSRLTEGAFEKKVDQQFKTSKLTENSIQEISELEFFEEMMYFLEGMNSGQEAQVPEILASCGITQQKLKELLIGHGILKVEKSEDGLIQKVQGNGISKSLGKLLADIKSQSEPKQEVETETEEELQEDYPAGAEHDPNAPYNEPDEAQEPFGDIEVRRIIETMDDFFILDTSEGMILAFGLNAGEDDRFDNQERSLSRALDHIDITSDAFEFTEGSSDAIILNNSNIGELINEFRDDFPELSQALSSLSGNFISEEDEMIYEDDSDRFQMIIFLQGDEAEKALSILENNGEDETVRYLAQWDNGDQDTEIVGRDSFGSQDRFYDAGEYALVYNLSYGYIGLYRQLQTLDEMTTTGSVGGSYETPAAWSKDPKKPRHSDKTAIKGGQFIKPGIGDNMDTIR